jgi:PBP1b-binding outer membrane lipoprotein LpoB
MKLYVLSIILLLIFSGCTGKPKPMIEVKQKALPTWIMNPPKSDSSALYGVGEGKDKKRGCCKCT